MRVDEDAEIRDGGGKGKVVAEESPGVRIRVKDDHKE